MVGFITIAFVVVKLKIFKVLHTNLESNGPFWQVFGPLFPQILSNIAKILTKGSALSSKQNFV